MRRFIVMLAALALLGVVFAPGAIGHDDQEIPAVPFDEESGAAHHSDVGLAAASTSSSGAVTGKHRNLTEIGSISFPDGANTDVWAHGKYAYVGTFSSGTAGFCPGTGVKIADVSDPTDPTFVTNIASPTSDILIPFVPGLQPGEIHTRANDVKVEAVSSRHFRGDLLVHTNEPCDGLGDGGIVLWDVTDPTNPQRLGSIYDLADLINGAPTGEAFGVHNTWIFERGQPHLCWVGGQYQPGCL